MYLDFGVDHMIKANEIIAIIDKKSFETATDTNDLLNHRYIIQKELLNRSLSQIIIFIFPHLHLVH